MEAKVRTMKSGLTAESLQHYRKCQRKRPSVRLKRLSGNVIQSSLKRKSEEESSGRVPTVRKIRNTARKSFSGYQNPPERDVVNDKVIDELLEDSDDDIASAFSVTIKPVEKNVPKNQIVTFATGFRTLEVPKIKEEVNTDAGVRSINVPRPLPELQKIYVKNPLISSSSSQNQSKSIDIVDLCSSDDE